MKGELQQIQELVQGVAEAIASALNMEVEIFDNNLVVVGATGRIRSKIGFKQETAHVTGHILKVGSSYTIENPGKHFLCARCKIRNDCFCTAALVCPITVNGRILGTISLLSFDREQREKLLDRQGQFLDFIARMGELIAGQVQLKEALNQVASSERHLKTIIDSVSEGIIAVDAETNITYLNKTAEYLLNSVVEPAIGRPIKQYLPDSPLPAVLQKRTAITGKEVNLAGGASDNAGKLLCSAYPIMLGEQAVGAVQTFKDIRQVARFARGLLNNPEQITFDDIKGNSPALKNLIRQARIVAAGNSTVLLRGESGTGKELFARAICQASPFRDGPFQVINCSAIPETLLESELFGYEGGAFTGARKGGKPGKFELADGGTLFLDEIGDMPLSLQAKLLRVLESRKLERIGGVKEYTFNVRIIAATNRDLEKMVAQGQFREDLYYRLNVIPLFIPSLRERQEDVITLAEFFLEKYNFLLRKKISDISNEAKELLLDYHWPGNVRELENVIEYAVNFEQTSSIRKNSLPQWMIYKDKVSALSSRLKIQTREKELEIIRRMLEEMGSSLEAKKAIAARLGISLTTLYRKLKQNV